jgi:hypothetical protein
VVAVKGELARAAMVVFPGHDKLSAIRSLLPFFPFILSLILVLETSLISSS